MPASEMETMAVALMVFNGLRALFLIRQILKAIRRFILGRWIAAFRFEHSKVLNFMYYRKAILKKLFGRHK